MPARPPKGSTPKRGSHRRHSRESAALALSSTGATEAMVLATGVATARAGERGGAKLLPPKLCRCQGRKDGTSVL